MTEKEIRTVLQRVRDELDRRARAILYPALVGAGLSLSACAPDVNLPYGVPDDWRVHHEKLGSDIPVYSVPFDKNVPSPDVVYGVRDVPHPKDARPGDLAPKKDGQPDRLAPKDARLDTVTPRDGIGKPDAGPPKG
jgi:hypothetical protein